MNIPSQMQLSELYIRLEEKANMAKITDKENEELTRTNLVFSSFSYSIYQAYFICLIHYLYITFDHFCQKLKRDIEKLQREFAGLQAAPPAAPVSLQHSNPYYSSADLTNTEEQDRERADSLHYGNPYEIMIGRPSLSTIQQILCHYASLMVLFFLLLQRDLLIKLIYSTFRKCHRPRSGSMWNHSFHNFFVVNE